MATIAPQRNQDSARGFAGDLFLAAKNSQTSPTCLTSPTSPTLWPPQHRRPEPVRQVRLVRPLGRHSTAGQSRSDKSDLVVATAPQARTGPTSLNAS